MQKTTARVSSIDVLRGIIMIIMALDHTRDYFHWPALTADPLNPTIIDFSTIAIYFTRWVTHFCAPVFVFLSGVSAYLASRKKSRNEASSFLMKRGLFLVVMEITVLTLVITFNPSFNFILLLVIWVIGMSMILLGLSMRVSDRFILIVGLILFFGHNIVDTLNMPNHPAIRALLTGPTGVPLSASHVLGISYTLLPWTGVMFMGYSVGKWFSAATPPEVRRRRLLITGFSMVSVFLLFRFTNIYGNPQPFVAGDSTTRTILNFLNTSKYPPSLLFVCMTVGPALIFLAIAENWNNRFTSFVKVYGNVPFFYYVVHFLLLHLLVTVVYFAGGYSSLPQGNSIMAFRPQIFGFGLPIVWAIWIGVVLIMYYPCKWFQRVKMNNKSTFLKYV